MNKKKEDKAEAGTRENPEGAAQSAASTAQWKTNGDGRTDKQTQRPPRLSEDPSHRLWHSVVPGKQHLKDELSELVPRFLNLFSRQIQFKGTKDPTPGNRSICGPCCVLKQI